MQVLNSRFSPKFPMLCLPFLLVCFLTSFLSCGQSTTPSPHLSSSSPISSNVIVGEVDWIKTSSLPTDDPARKNAKAVGYISIPSQHENRCTGFLVAPDLLMTNWHCFPKPSSAQGARFYPEFEEAEMDADYLNTPSFACDQILLSNEKLDFALLKCQENLGDQYGMVELDGRQNSFTLYEPIYVIHQNCDYWNNYPCPAIKLYSPGQITEVDQEASLEVKSRDVFYNSDTLGGSSGSPVFSGKTHRVIALHHFGHAKGSYPFGRGRSNSGIPLFLIADYLKNYHPQISLNFVHP